MTNTTINKTFLIVLLGILAALGPFSIDMYLPGFNQITDTFSTNEQQIAFTLTSYFLGIALGQLFYGPLVDKYGRKKPLLVGLSIYSVASIGCALAPNLNSLIVIRFLQAIGGCVGMVASNAIISDVYPVEKRAKAFSLIMLVMGVAPLIAPSIGSLVLANFGWRTIFYFLTLFSLLVGCLIFFFLPETSRFLHQDKLKVKTITLDYVGILKNRTFLLYTLASSLAMAVLFAYISSASFIFQTFFGLSRETFAIIFAINATGLITGSYINGILTTKVSFIKIGRIASIVLLFATFLVFIVVNSRPTIHYTLAVGGIFTILFLIGFINPNTTAASFAPFSGNVGAASALGGSIRMAAAALIASIVGVFQNDSILTTFGIMFILAFIVLMLVLSAPKLKFDKQKNRP
ncbi:MAG: multidrug effflux MFS transporter [Crocinitomicaceae bacterium]|nr:multidrug effflux MFS transporter [Crocinitomicaceae bacterium]